MLKEQGKEEVNAFDRAWSSAVKNARDGEHVSPELKPLLLDVYLKVLAVSDQDLPEPLHDVFAMMGQALHDTVQSPEIAENFGCLPEQLLSQLRQFEP